MIIYVPEDIMTRLENQLQKTPEQIPHVLRKTINDTAKSTRREVTAQAREAYTVKTGNFNKAMMIENATQRYPQATIHTEGNPLALYGFKRRSNSGKTGAKAQVIKQGSLKSLTLEGGSDKGKDLKAFIQKVKNKNGSSHVGIFRRMTSSERQKSGSKEENAIKQFYSLSVPQMLGNEQKVYSEVQPFIVEELRKNLEKHIAKVMEGMK